MVSLILLFSFSFLIVFRDEVQEFSCEGYNTFVYLFIVQSVPSPHVYIEK